MRCSSCNRGLTGSWSKGRREYYAYYHCRPGCGGLNVTKAKLEWLFGDELARLQPSPGYMRLLKESVLQIWKARKEAVRADLADAERRAKAIRLKLDRLDEAFLFEQSIDIDVYDRHAEKLREELTLLRKDRHASEVEELDVEGILALAERILPRAVDQASLDQRQRFQQLFFPDGLAFDGAGFVGTAVTAPAFNYLRPIETGSESLVDLTGSCRLRRAVGDAGLPEHGQVRPRRAKRGVVDQNIASWNRMMSWLQSLERLRPLCDLKARRR